MMEDKMRDFINEHHEEFETDIPSEGVWQGISAKLGHDHKSTHSWSWLRIAAALVLLLGIGTAVKYIFWSDNRHEPIAKKAATPGVDEMVPMISVELQEVEHYYQSEVNQRKKELGNYEIDEELLEEVDLLKQEFEELKVEMGQTADPSKVVEAMIANYQMRLEILKDILEAMKKEENNNHIKNKQDDEIL